MKGKSIAARGLSGQVYKGAVFWDTEMFMLDYYLYTEPKIARTLVKYRIDTLDGAKKKAKSYGYDGAFYAWESQEGGYDACSDGCWSMYEAIRHLLWKEEHPNPTALDRLSVSACPPLILGDQPLINITRI